MKENGTIQSAPIIRAVILIALFGMLAWWAQAYGAALASATNRPVGAGCWNMPGRPWGTCYRQENGLFGPGGMPIVGRVETWAPKWPVPPRAPMPSVAPVPGSQMPGWEYPVSRLAPHLPMPRIAYPVPTHPDPWYVTRPYTGGHKPMASSPYPRGVIRQSSLRPIDSEAWYR